MSRGRRINQKIEEEIFDAGFNDDANVALTNIFKKKRLPNPANVIGLQKEHGRALLLQDARPEEHTQDAVVAREEEEEEEGGKAHSDDDDEEEATRKEIERLLKEKERRALERIAQQYARKDESPVDDEIAQITDPRGDPPPYTEEEENARLAAEIQAEVRRKFASPSAWGQRVRMGTITPQNLSRQHSLGSDRSSLSETEERPYTASLLEELRAIDTVRGGKEEEEEEGDDDDDDEEFAAFEAQVPMSIEDNPNASIQDILDTEFVSGDDGLLVIKAMPEDGDCLFRAFALYLNEYPEVFGNIIQQFPDLVSLSGRDKMVALSFELRKIIVGIITSEAFWSGEDGGYETRLKAEGRGFDTKEEYIKHMTLGSKARTTIEEEEEEGSRYIPRLNQGGEIEIQVFAEIVAGIKYIVIQANKELDGTDHNNIRFMHGDEARLMKPRTLRLLRYEDTFPNKPGSHYDFLELTKKGKEEEAGMGELAELVKEDEGIAPVPATTTASPQIQKIEREIIETRKKAADAATKKRDLEVKAKKYIAENKDRERQNLPKKHNRDKMLRVLRQKKFQEKRLELYKNKLQRLAMMLRKGGKRKRKTKRKRRKKKKSTRKRRR